MTNLKRVHGDSISAEMSTSDHHRARPKDAAKPAEPPDDNPRVLYPTVSYEHSMATVSIKPLDLKILRSLQTCSLAVRDIKNMVPYYSVHRNDEEHLVALSEDVQVLGRWVQTTLEAFRSATATSAPATPALAPKASAPPPPKAAAQHAQRKPTTSVTKSAHPVLPPPAVPRPATSPKPATAPTQLPQSPDSPPSTASHTLRPPHRPELSPQTTSLPTPRSTPQPDSAPSARVIVRYNDSSCPQHRPHPRTIVQSVNAQFKRDVLAAVSYSRTDQLVLHTKLPVTARDLLGDPKSLRSALDSILFPSAAKVPPLTFDTGEPWSKVVLHGVPLPIWEGKASVDRQLRTLASDLCAANNVTNGSIQQIRPLCARADLEKVLKSSTESSPRLVSVLICLSDHDVASQLLRSGAILQSAYCRATAYRPRTLRDPAAA